MTWSAPIRFLAVVLAGWAGLRLVVLAPRWGPGDVSLTAGPGSDAVAGPRLSAEPPGTGAIALHAGAAGHSGSAAAWRRSRTWPSTRWTGGRVPGRQMSVIEVTASSSFGPASATDGRVTSAQGMIAAAPPPVALPVAGRPPTAGSRRLTGTAWLLLRGEGAPGLAPGGTLGGSQAGGRILYRLNDDLRRPIALSLRAYAPLRRPAGAETAIGLDLRPVAGLPVHMLAERRQSLGREGRSAWSLAVHGGGAITLARRWRLDGYAQAGLIGMRSRDAFVDGVARIMRPIGPLEIGGGAWGGAQPDAARIDVGPVLALPVSAAGASLRLAAEYRLRIVGDARPASGPALTLGVDF